MDLGLIYARESKYEKKQGNRSPEEQVDAGLAWCEQASVTPLPVDGQPAIIDAGIGASRHSTGMRNGWTRAKRIIAGQDPEVPQPTYLIVWASSRTTRQLGEYVELRDLCAKHGVKWVVKGRVYNLSRADDRLASGINAVVDDHRAEELREDVRRALRSNALEGRPHGEVPYGYRRIYHEETKAYVRQEPHPGQAPIVKRIFREFATGISTRTIASRLNADGIPSARGMRWDAGTIRRMLHNPAYAGKRSHRGKTTKDDAWKPLIGEKRLVAVEERLKHTTVPQRRRTSPMLAGVVMCGVCGDKLHKMPKGPHNIPAYRCPLNYHLSRLCDRVDAYVAAAVLERLSRPDVGKLLDGGEDPAVTAARKRVDELREQLDETVRQYTNPPPGEARITASTLAQVEAELTAQIAEAERRVRSAVVPIELDLPVDGEWEKWWAERTHEQRREIVAALVATVELTPVGRGHKVYEDADYTTITWRR